MVTSDFLSKLYRSGRIDHAASRCSRRISSIAAIAVEISATTSKKRIARRAWLAASSARSAAALDALTFLIVTANPTTAISNPTMLAMSPA